MQVMVGIGVQGGDRVRTARKLLIGSVFVCLLLGAVACESLGRGDVHLTVEVREDRSCSLQAEFDFSLVSDWLLALVPKTKPQPDDPQDRSLELLQTTRDSQEYAAVLVHFADVNDLQNLINTTGFVQKALPWLEKLLETLGEDVEIPDFVASVLSDLPTPFSSFQVRVNDSSPLWTTYEFEAEVNATTASLMAPFADVTYHVILPGLVTSNNAHRREQGALTWDLREGQALEMRARSRVSKLPGGNVGLWILGGVGILILVAIVGGGVYWTVSRSRRGAPSKPPTYEEPAFDFGDDYGSEFDDYGETDPGYDYDDVESEYGKAGDYEDYDAKKNWEVS